MSKKLTSALIGAIAISIITMGFTGELLGGTLIAEAATPRSAWVQNEIYQYNHQFAAQLPTELATKMQKMSECAFAFYRGTAHLFYKDLISIPASNFTNIPTASTWLSGDMHLMNMGVIRDSNGKSVFDTTDFDEGYLGSYTWDLRRMAVSILLTAKENGLSKGDRQDVVKVFLDTYLNKIKQFKGTDKELPYSVDINNTNGVVNDLIQKSNAQSRRNFLSKYTTVNAAGKRVFLTTTELQAVSDSAYRAIASSMNGYITSIASSKRYGSSYYTLKDVRLKLGSGTGSLGRYRYFLLIEGASSSTGDEVILEMKQEITSAVAIAAPNRLPANTYNFNEAQRVAMSMKSMLSNTDPLVGYTNVGNISYFIREKSPYQVDFDYTLLTSKSKFTEAMVFQAKVLAKNHALSDKDYNSSIVPYSQDREITDLAESNPSAFKIDILNFALNYATQVELDYNSFKRLYQNKAPFY